MSMEKCKLCKQREDEYKKKNPEESVLLEHVTRATVTGKKTPQKEETLHHLAKAANALLNSDGGDLLIHVDGQQQWDRDLELLDEAIGKRFSTLLPDDCQYCDYFSRKWLSNDFLFFRIAHIHGVSTLDSKTKMRNDFENVNAPCSVIANILKYGGDKEAQTPSKPIRLTCLDDMPLHEDRESELKWLPPKAQHEKAVENVTDYIWNDLKLNHNITAMSKLQGGGRYCLGISEKPFNEHGYKTKKRNIDGFHLSIDINELIQSLNNKMKTDIIVLTVKGSFHEAPSDLIAAYALPEKDKDKFVLTVNINHFNGVVFHDKEGPEVYTFRNGAVCRMSKEEWLHRLLSSRHQPQWTRPTQAVDPSSNMEMSIASSSNRIAYDHPTTFKDDGQGRQEHRKELQNRKDSIKRKWTRKHEKGKAKTYESLSKLQQSLQDLKPERSKESMEPSEIYALQQEIRVAE